VGVAGATDAERAWAEGATDAERVIPRRDNGEARYDGDAVGDATRELGGDADDRDADTDAVDTAGAVAGVVTKRLSSVRRL
jgi:hypothetical protein